MPSPFQRPLTGVWPVALSPPLPTVPIPLLPRDPHALLDLQPAFTAAYDPPGYDLALDSTQPPDVALEGQAVPLSGALLQAAGKRAA